MELKFQQSAQLYFHRNTVFLILAYSLITVALVVEDGIAKKLYSSPSTRTVSRHEVQGKPESTIAPRGGARSGVTVKEKKTRMYRQLQAEESFDADASMSGVDNKDTSGTSNEGFAGEDEAKFIQSLTEAGEIMASNRETIESIEGKEVTSTEKESDVDIPNAEVEGLESGNTRELIVNGEKPNSEAVDGEMTESDTEPAVSESVDKSSLSASLESLRSIVEKLMFVVKKDDSLINEEEETFGMNEKDPTTEKKLENVNVDDNSDWAVPEIFGDVVTKAFSSEVDKPVSADSRVEEPMDNPDLRVVRQFYWNDNAALTNGKDAQKFEEHSTPIEDGSSEVNNTSMRGLQLLAAISALGVAGSGGYVWHQRRLKHQIRYMRLNV